MAGQYSHRQFFRHTPNALLARYFKINKIEFDIDWAKTAENGKCIFNVFIQLDAMIQNKIETDFVQVNALACEAGIQALVDESAYYHDDTFVADIAAIDGFHAKALWAFIEKPQYWYGASMFLHADNISAGFWKKRRDLPSLSYDIGDEAVTALSNAISDYFYQKEARGRHCKIERYRRHDKEYFFAYPEDHAKSYIEWVSDDLTSRAIHPAFEIIFVYSGKEGSLDVYAPKNTKAVPELQRLFAKHILNMDSLSDGALDHRVYELSAVGEPNFEFIINPELGIESVVVTRLKLRLNNKTRETITLEADTKESANAVYDLLDKLAITDYFIIQVDIKIAFVAGGCIAPCLRRFASFFAHYLLAIDSLLAIGIKNSMQ